MSDTLSFMGQAFLDLGQGKLFFLIFFGKGMIFIGVQREERR
jgi:hypothetical protein